MITALHQVFGRKYIYIPPPNSKVLDLPLQNNFTDTTGINTIIAGGASNLPTFTLDGTEYAAVFNGSQSLKTDNLFNINSDKISISFWIKASTNGMIMELSENLNLYPYNGFWIFIGNVASTKLEFLNRNLAIAVNNIIVTNNSVIDNTWKHIVIVSDRGLGTSMSKMYVNNVLSFVQNQNSDINGNFIPKNLFIGQRGGSTGGFNGQLKFLKIFNYPLSTTEITNLYNKIM